MGIGVISVGVVVGTVGDGVIEDVIVGLGEIVLVEVGVSVSVGVFVGGSS